MLPRPATATTTDGWHWNGGSVVACLCMFIHRTTPISESSPFIGGGGDESAFKGKHPCQRHATTFQRGKCSYYLRRLNVVVVDVDKIFPLKVLSRRVW